jgi:flagellar basal-body rod protein FlgF
MDRVLYVAMTGARQIEHAQATNNHNLANVNTSGFRADLAAFRAMPLYGPGHPTRVYAMAERPGVNMTAGAVTATGRELDVAINGEGWIAVQGRDGTTGYTRRGDMRVGANGQLETGDGHAVLGNGGPIALPPAEKIEIGGDGTISIRPVGQAATALAVVDRIRLVRPDPAEMVKGADGLMRLNNGKEADPDARVQIVAGALEASNVNAVDALVNMITLQRQYEMQVKVMREAKDNDAVSAQVMRMG